MSYITEFTLTVEPESFARDKVFEEYRTDYDLFTERGNKLYATGSWYDHDIDMLNLSERFPEVLFILDGVGEEYPDIWRAFYMNGKTYHIRAPELVWPPFDKENLVGA